MAVQSQCAPGEGRQVSVCKSTFCLRHCLVNMHEKRYDLSQHNKIIQEV